MLRGPGRGRVKGEPVLMVRPFPFSFPFFRSGEAPARSPQVLILWSLEGLVMVTCRGANRGWRNS